MIIPIEIIQIIWNYVDIDTKLSINKVLKPYTCSYQQLQVDKPFIIKLKAHYAIKLLRYTVLKNIRSIIHNRNFN